MRYKIEKKAYAKEENVYSDLVEYMNAMRKLIEIFDFSETYAGMVADDPLVMMIKSMELILLLRQESQSSISRMQALRGQEQDGENMDEQKFYDGLEEIVGHLSKVCNLQRKRQITNCKALVYEIFKTDIGKTEGEI